MEGFSFKEAANYVLGFVTVVMGWDISRLNDLKEKHADFREQVALTYVTREDLSDWMDRTDNTLDRILEKLDNKQDK